MADLQINKRGGNSCSAVNCYNSRVKNPNLSFYNFPRDIERCKKWILNSRREDLEKKDPALLHKKGYFICEKHFEESEFKNPNAARKRLNWNAIPTIFDVPNPHKQIKIQRKNPTVRIKKVCSKNKVEISSTIHTLELQSEKEDTEKKVLPKRVFC